MGVPKRLTDMQMKFAEFLVFGGHDGPMTQTEAALAAGYSPNRARVEASELTNPRQSPLVVKYIGELKEERLKKHELIFIKILSLSGCIARPISECSLQEKSINEKTQNQVHLESCLCKIAADLL